MTDRKKRPNERPLTDHELVEESGEESFPASDPPSFTPAAPGEPRNDGGPEDGEGATSEQLRDDIDSGRTGDKVRGRDPSAAPLGTDDEAGGESNEPEDISRSRQRERRK